MDKKVFAILLGMSLLLSAPSFLRIPSVLPFLDPEIRAAAPRAMEELRSQGLWLVNVDFLKVEKADEEICFHWLHRYRSRLAIAEPEELTTCISS
jgi:hypothetical protein